jgi:hypothetical protein
MEHLEGDLTAAQVIRKEDARGPTPADLSMHCIPVSEGVPDDRQQVAADGAFREGE